MQITVTRPPVSMIALACLPTSVPAATAARNMSPVDSCGMLSSETILGACVPFPARTRQLAALGGALRIRLPHMLRKKYKVGTGAGRTEQDQDASSHFPSFCRHSVPLLRRRWLRPLTLRCGIFITPLHPLKIPATSEGLKVKNNK